METKQPEFITLRSSSKKKIFISLIAFGLIVAAGLCVFAWRGFDIPWLGPLFRGNIAQAELETLKQNSKVPFNPPIIISEEQIHISNMSEQARALFPSDHKIFWVYKLALSDGTTGYRAEYHPDTQVISEYRDFLDRWYEQGPYKTVASTRSDNAAYSVMENQFYKLEAEFLQSSANSTIVKVMILLK